MWESYDPLPRNTFIFCDLQLATSGFGKVLSSGGKPQGTANQCSTNSHDEESGVEKFGGFPLSGGNSRLWRENWLGSNPQISEFFEGEGSAKGLPADVSVMAWKTKGHTLHPTQISDSSMWTTSILGHSDLGPRVQICYIYIYIYV